MEIARHNKTNCSHIYSIPFCYTQGPIFVYSLPTMTISFGPGDKAIIVGLQCQSELNGTHVTIKKVLKNGRISVTIPQPVSESPRDVAIKEENLHINDKCHICHKVQMRPYGQCDDVKGMGDLEKLVLSAFLDVGANADVLCWRCGIKVCVRCIGMILGSPEPKCPSCGEDRSLKSFETEHERIRERMKCGDLDATFYLAQLIDFGNGGVRQDKILARALYAKAAGEGHAEAAQNLACCCRDGEGGPKDSSEFLKWTKVAAERGHPGAMSNLADAYFFGVHGAAKDLELAACWYKKAIACGHKRAFSLDRLGMIQRKTRYV